MLKSLAQLPCFNSIKTITPINIGLSRSCFKVVTKTKRFFAKNLSHDCLDSEIIAAQHAAINNLSAKVVFHNHDWLITEFIEGENLKVSPLSFVEKSTIALTLMKRFHQLDFYLPILDPDRIMLELISLNNFTKHQLLVMNNARLLITKLLALNSSIHTTKKDSKEKTRVKLVNCHGDVNFSNIMVKQENENTNNYLVDFECACAAPAEFDVAMFIAINNLEPTQLHIVESLFNTLSATIQNINKQNATSIICQERLENYLFFSYFINGLWYLAKAKLAANNILTNNILDNKNQSQFLNKLAMKQFQAFDQLTLPTFNKSLMDYL